MTEREKINQITANLVKNTMEIESLEKQISELTVDLVYYRTERTCLLRELVRVTPGGEEYAEELNLFHNEKSDKKDSHPEKQAEDKG